MREGGEEIERRPALGGGHLGTVFLHEAVPFALALRALRELDCSGAWGRASATRHRRSSSKHARSFSRREEAASPCRCEGPHPGIGQSRVEQFERSLWRSGRSFPRRVDTTGARFRTRARHGTRWGELSPCPGRCPTPLRASLVRDPGWVAPGELSSAPFPRLCLAGRDLCRSPAPRRSTFASPNGCSCP